MMEPTWTIDGEDIATCRGHISLEHLGQQLKTHLKRQKEFLPEYWKVQHLSEE